MDNNQQAAMQINMGGELINIEQDFFDKYPESFLAEWKAQQKELGKEDDRIEIDRSAKYFKKILEFSRDKQAIRFYLMSHIEITQIRNDAAFFGIEDIVERCEKELKVMRQSSIPSFTDQESLDLLLEGETRLVIIVDSRCCHRAEVMNACVLLNRDKCLIISRQGYFSGHGDSRNIYENNTWKTVNTSYGYILYDPMNRKNLLTRLHEDGSDLLAMVYHAETLTRHALDYVDNPYGNMNAIFVRTLEL